MAESPSGSKKKRGTIIDISRRHTLGRFFNKHESSPASMQRDKADSEPSSPASESPRDIDDPKQPVRRTLSSIVQTLEDDGRSERSSSVDLANSAAAAGGDAGSPGSGGQVLKLSADSPMAAINARAAAELEADAAPASPAPRAVYAEPENIWDEPEDSDATIMSLPAQESNGLCVRAATLNKLVWRLVSGVYAADVEKLYIKVFFLTYRSFSDSKVVLAKLEQLFWGKPGESFQQAEERVPPLSEVKRRVSQVLSFWLRSHVRDFTSSAPLSKQMREFIAKALDKDPAPDFHLVTSLSKTCEEMLGKGTFSSLFAGAAPRIDDSPASIVPKDWKTATFMDLDELEIVRQMTINESHLYAEIQPIELQDLAWSKPKLKERAPNVLGLIERFNKMSGIFATLIVSTPTKKQRVKVVEKLVKMAVHCVELHNFNSLNAIMSCLQNNAVYRLNHTFQAMPAKSLQKLQELHDMMSSNSSYKSYREVIAKTDAPCIPFLGVYLTDLTFVEDGNADTVGGLVNFRKKTLEYDVILQVLKYQGTGYNFKMVPKLNSLLDSLPVMGEKDLYNKSLEIEPRGATKKDIK